MGFALPALLPRRYTQIGATVLFLFFGIKLLKDGWEHQEGEPNEVRCARLSRCDAARRAAALSRMPIAGARRG
jgi:putative Ca2+/H+ antiporter (TMEM165/GDT1 family)